MEKWDPVGDSFGPLGSFVELSLPQQPFHSSCSGKSNIFKPVWSLNLYKHDLGYQFKLI